MSSYSIMVNFKEPWCNYVTKEIMVSREVFNLESYLLLSQCIIDAQSMTKALPLIWASL